MKWTKNLFTSIFAHGFDITSSFCLKLASLLIVLKIFFSLGSVKGIVKCLVFAFVSLFICFLLKKEYKTYKTSIKLENASHVMIDKVSDTFATLASVMFVIGQVVPFASMKSKITFCIFITILFAALDAFIIDGCLETYGTKIANALAGIFFSFTSALFVILVLRGKGGLLFAFFLVFGTLMTCVECYFEDKFGLWDIISLLAKQFAKVTLNITIVYIVLVLLKFSNAAKKLFILIPLMVICNILPYVIKKGKKAA